MAFENTLKFGKWYATFDEQGNCTKAVYEDSYRKILGYDTKEVGAKNNENWAALIHEDDKERTELAYIECLKKHPEGYDYDCEYRMLTKTGYRWFHDHGICTRREDGSLLRCDGVMFDIQDVKDKEILIEHNKLKNEMIMHFNSTDEDPIKLLEIYAQKLRVLFDCDQVIYRDLEETRIMINSDGIKDNWAVPIDYCKQCPHFNAFHPMYKDGYTIMNNCQKGYKGVPVYEKCPIKSSLTRIIYCDKEVAGYLAIHYVNNYHKFTKIEEDTFEHFARALSMSISKFNAKKKTNELSSLQRTMGTVFALSNYDPIIVFDPYTGEYDWLMSLAEDVDNNTSMTIHGEDLYKSIGIDSATIIHPEDREQYQKFYTRENMLKIVETGVSQETENRWFIETMGEYRYKYNKAVKIVDEKGKIYIAVGVIDTTDEKRKEKEINDQKKILNLSNYFFALEDNIESIYDVDLETGHYSSYDRGDFYKSIVREKLISETEFFSDLKVNIEVVICDEDKKTVFENLSKEKIVKQLEHNEHFDFIYRVKGSDKPIWFKIRIVYKDETKKNIIIGVFNVEDDIESAQLKEAYNKLDEMNTRTLLLHTTIHASLWTYRIDKNDNVVSVNYDNYTQLKIPEEILKEPMSWLKGIHEEDRGNVEKAFRAAIEDHTCKTPYEITYRMITNEGNYTWIKSSGRIKRYDDGSAELFGISVDFTEQIKKEIENSKQLEEARQLAEAANKSKTTFLFNMSHDIRTPMNAIQGFALMAKKYIDDKEKVIDYIDKIDIAGDKLLTLINQVLEMSRIESGKIEFVNKRVDVKREFSSMITIVSEQAYALGIDFKYALKDIKHNFVKADETRISSVTLNIVGNALKYTKSGGKVYYELKEVEPRKKGYATFVFTVEDNGIGMTEEFQKEIFEPFSRESSETVSKIEGTGLGLSIVKNTIDLLGGEIKLNSKLGKGTKFEITLDFKIDESNGSKQSIDEVVNIKSFAGKRLLLVEDNEMNREIATDVLMDYGFIVEYAEDGDIAVDKVKYHCDEGEYNYYDFILMDIQMPRMNGFEATKAIRAIQGPDDVHIPIIAMTANAFEEDRKNALAAGMDDHCSKPIDLEKLLKTICRYIK